MFVSDKSDALLAELSICETRVWDALVQGDMEADRSMLAEDFLGVYPDGFADREIHASQLVSGPTVETYNLSGHRVLQLGREHALLSYRAEYMRTGRTVPDVMYVSSIWWRGEGGWVNIFSQDTPVNER